jgi:hypothetical protein
MASSPLEPLSRISERLQSMTNMFLLSEKKRLDSFIIEMVIKLSNTRSKIGRSGIILKHLRLSNAQVSISI